MKIPKATDRRVKRTRRVLRDSLLALVAERGWDAVSVLDVCERAEVGRSTFYTHFADKEALLLSGFDDLREFLRSQPAERSPLPFLRGLIEHANENRRLFRSLIGKRAGVLAQKNFRDFVLTMTRESLAGLLGERSALEAASRFIAGGIAELLIWSTDLRSPLAAEDLELLCLQFSEPVLARLRR